MAVAAGGGLVRTCAAIASPSRLRWLALGVAANAAHGASLPCDTRHAVDRSRRLGPFRCHGREARPARPRRPTGHHRRRLPCCRARLMLTRAAPWRAFGNADVQGAVGVGAAMQRRLVGNGITPIGHPRRARRARVRHPLRPGRRAARPSRVRRGCSAVDAHAPAYAISAETTLRQDEADAEGLATLAVARGVGTIGPRDACRPRCAAPYHISPQGRV